MYTIKLQKNFAVIHWAHRLALVSSALVLLGTLIVTDFCAVRKSVVSKMAFQVIPLTQQCSWQDYKERGLEHSVVFASKVFCFS